MIHRRWRFSWLACAGRRGVRLRRRRRSVAEARRRRGQARRTSRGRGKVQSGRRAEAQECRRRCSRTWKRTRRARKKEQPTLRRRLEQAGFANDQPADVLDDLRHRGALVAASVCHRHPPVAAGGRAWPCSWWASACRAGCWASSPRGARRNSPRNSPTPSTSSCARSSRAFRPTKRCASWRARRPIRWAANSHRLVEGLKVGVTLEQGAEADVWNACPRRKWASSPS